MNCTSCGANLPPGATTCPLCGTPSPYNVNPSSGSSPNDPTIASSSYGGAPPPSTAYGAPPYGTPQEAQNPYYAPSQPPQNYYGAPPPSQQSGYVPPPLQQGGYIPPPSQPGGMYAPQQLPQRRSRLPLILGIIALVLVVGCAGISFAVYQGLKQTGNSLVTSLDATASAIVATATTISTPPPAKTIDPAAAAIIKNPQTSSAIDNNLAPTKPTSTFAVGKDVYVTFDISSNGQDGYIEAKWYQNGQQVSTRQFHHSASNDVGYFSRSFANSGDGVAEIYWCTKADCSDEKLAQIVKFTVTPTGFIPSTRPVVVVTDMKV